MEAYSASMGWPPSMVPLRSMVTEAITGIGIPSSRRSFCTASKRGLEASGVETGLDQQEIRAAFHQRLGLLVVSVVQLAGK